MDVRLPDGTIIQNVPDGTTKAQLAEKLRASGRQVPAEWLAEPTQGRAGALSAGQRFGMGIADPIHGGAQLLTKLLPQSVVDAGNALNNWLADNTGLVARLPEGGVDELVRERERQYAADKPEGFDFARLTGNILSPVNLALSAAAPAKAAAGIGARAVAGGALGAGAAALAPMTEAGDFSEQKAKQIGLGGLFGAATPAVAAGVGRVISPRASVNPQVQALRAAGIKPTIGQTLGGSFSRAEEKLMSLPITGDAINSARGRALTQFNREAINRATRPIGVKIDEVGHDGIKAAGDALSAAYDDVLTGMKSVKFDQKFYADLRQLKDMAKALPSNVRGSFSTHIKSLLDDRISPARGMTAQTVKELESELGALARQYGRSPVSSERLLGDSLQQAQSLVRDQVARQSPKAAETIKRLNEGWANLVRVERAAVAARNNGGLFTPAQLNTAITAADHSVRKRAVGRGTALMQDLGAAGQQVLGNRTPNSGTTDRLMLGAGALGSGMIEPSIPIGLLLGAGAYTPPVQALMRGAVAARPQAAQSVAGLLNQASPMLAPAGGLLALEVAK